MSESSKNKFPIKVKPKKATMQDVAKLAGVVPSTVSHVINGTANITPKTKERVYSAIQKLNYLPNALARALRQSRSRLIGVVLSDISSEFYARCAASILQMAQKDKNVVLLCDSQFNPQIAETGVNALLERRVDGLIFIGGAGDERIIQRAQLADVAVVLGDRRLTEELPSVEFDNFNTVETLVRALYQSGYRRFGYIGEPVNVQHNLVFRYGGFVQGLKNCGVLEKDITVILDDALHEIKLQSAYKMFEHFWENTPVEQLPQVVLTSNDMIAQGLISAIKRNGLRVPQDIAVVGFDDVGISQFFSPSITTVAQDANMLGERCYSLLQDILYGRKKTMHEVLHQTIIVRESAVISDEILSCCQKSQSDTNIDICALRDYTG